MALFSPSRLSRYLYCMYSGSITSFTTSGVSNRPLNKVAKSSNLKVQSRVRESFLPSPSSSIQLKDSTQLMKLRQLQMKTQSSTTWLLESSLATTQHSQRYRRSMANSISSIVTEILIIRYLRKTFKLTHAQQLSSVSKSAILMSQSSLIHYSKTHGSSLSSTSNLWFALTSRLSLKPMARPTLTQNL